MSEFEKYIVQGEPSKKAKANAWQTAIGLQDVDGLKPSGELILMPISLSTYQIPHLIIS